MNRTFFLTNQEFKLKAIRSYQKIIHYFIIILKIFNLQVFSLTNLCLFLGKTLCQSHPAGQKSWKLFALFDFIFQRLGQFNIYGDSGGSDFGICCNLLLHVSHRHSGWNFTTGKKIISIFERKNFKNFVSRFSLTYSLINSMTHLCLRQKSYFLKLIALKILSNNFGTWVKCSWNFYQFFNFVGQFCNMSNFFRHKINNFEEWSMNFYFLSNHIYKKVPSWLESSPWAWIFWKFEIRLFVTQQNLFHWFDNKTKAFW